MTDAGLMDRRGAPEGTAAPSARRGRVGVYAVAFALLLAAGTVLVVASLRLSSFRLLWLSAGLSAGALVVSIVSLALPRR